MLHIIYRVGANMFTERITQVAAQLQVVDQFIDDLDLGVDIFFKKDVEGNEANGECYAESNGHIIPAVLKIIVDSGNRYGHRQRIYKYQDTQFHTVKLRFVRN